MMMMMKVTAFDFVSTQTFFEQRRRLLFLLLKNSFKLKVGHKSYTSFVLSLFLFKMRDKSGAKLPGISKKVLLLLFAVVEVFSK